jgi:hypothetical protein
MMRAKMQVRSVERVGETQENLSMAPVTGDTPFGANGESEDNTFARYTPSGALSLTITNPELIGKFAEGDKFYLDFTKAE